MTPEQKRIKIAECCGIKMCACGGNCMMDNGGDPLPNFLNSLDAMAQAEATLTSDELDCYCDELGGSLAGCALAPAWKRADAFLKVKGIV